MVFQNYNLFKNKTALEKAKTYLEIVDLSDKHDNYWNELSGGQQQRVGITRALAVNPDIILFDEPTSSLDPELVGEVLKVIRDVAKKHTTMIIVTHEMEFAREISDRIVFMSDGVILEQGTPYYMFNETAYFT